MPNYRKRLIILIILLSLVLGLGVFSYAYFSAQISGNETSSSVTLNGGKMNIAFNDGNPNIVANNISPEKEAFATKTFTITGTNTTDTKMNYELFLIIDANTFTDNAISYTLEGVNTSLNGGLVSNINDTALVSGALTTRLGIGYFDGNSTNKTHTYTLKIFFKETENDQNIDQNKMFKAHVSLDGRNIKSLTLSGTNNSLTNTQGKNIIDYKIYGKSLQNGTPTIETPISVQSLSDAGNINVITKGKNLLKNTDFSGTVATNVAWDTTLNGTLGLYNWYYYNGGVASPTTGYHAHVNTTKFDTNVVEFANKNSEYGYPQRWLGISQRVLASDIKPGVTYTISMDIYSESIGTKNTGGLYYSLNSAPTSYNFKSGQYNFVSTSNEVNKWVRKSFSFKILDDANLSGTFSIYVYGHSYTPESTTYIKNILFEEGNTATEHEVFKESKTYPVSLTEPLRCIDDVCDYIDYKNQKIVRNVGVKTFDGSESLTIWSGQSTSATSGIYWSDSASLGVYKSPTFIAKGMCSHFVLGSSAYGIDDALRFSLTPGSNPPYISFRTPFLNTTDFKTWLKSQYDQGTPVTVYYQLINPTLKYISLPEIKTLTGTTLVEVNDGSLKSSKIEITY